MARPCESRPLADAHERVSANRRRNLRSGLAHYPNIERFPGGASNDMIPNLQNPKNPLPYDPVKQSKTVGAGGG
jgi:hypothetical protein